jgi:WD40 repeat protein
MATLQDGRVVGLVAGRLQVWDPAAGDAQPVELGERGGGVQAVAVLPDGRVVIGCGRRLLVWKIAEPAAGPVELVGDTEAVQAIAVLPDGRLVSGNHAGRLLVWNPGQPVVRPVELGSHGGQLSALVALQDGWVVSGGYDGRMGGISEYAGRLRVWNPSQPGAEPVELGSHGERVRAVAELPDGRVVSGWADGRVLVWDRSAPEAKPIDVGKHDGPVEAVAVLPDGQVLTGGDDRSVRLWDVQTKLCCWSIGCSVRALTAVNSNSGETLLLITHQGTGVSTWSVRAARPTAPQP